MTVTYAEFPYLYFGFKKFEVTADQTNEQNGRILIEKYLFSILP